MSRSKHTSRRAVHEEARWDYRPLDARRERLTKGRQELAEKRGIKRQVRAERRGEHIEAPAPVGVTTIPIRVQDEGPFVHYPASVEDLREVLRCLPAGVADGIEAIEFTLGTDCQREYVVRKGLRGDKIDPCTGRHGMEALPGIHCGHILGTYYAPRGLIQLYGYVHDPAVPNFRIKETYLKLLFLSTFVHEIAHHEDRSRRVSRGRWRFDNKRKTEIYAERAEHDWAKEVVVPYLQNAYGERVAELEDWIEGHGGVRILLAWLGVDPGTKVKGGRVLTGLLPIDEAFQELVRDVESGLDRETIRRNLAMNLHYGDHFELALHIVEALLAEEPGDLQSLTAKADYLNHLERHAEAGAILRQVLATDSELEEAWNIQALVARDMKDWARVLEATTHELRLADRRDVWVVARQARALLELERFEELGERVRELKAHSSRYASEGFDFHALALLRTGRSDEALCVAEEGLEVAKKTIWCHVLLGVRYEALCRTGRRQEAEPLRDTTFEMLERLGYEDWVRRLKEI